MNLNKEKELEEYELDIATRRVADMFEGGGITNTGQSWRASLLEAHINSAVGGPLSIFAHVLLLLAAGLSATWENAIIFASASWPVFFYLSVSRVFLFRRIFEKYGLHLEPTYLFKYLKASFGKHKN